MNITSTSPEDTPPLNFHDLGNSLLYSIGNKSSLFNALSKAPSFWTAFGGFFTTSFALENDPIKKALDLPVTLIETCGMKKDSFSGKLLVPIVGIALFSGAAALAYHTASYSFIKGAAFAIHLTAMQVFLFDHEKKPDFIPNLTNSLSEIIYGSKEIPNEMRSIIESARSVSFLTVSYLLPMQTLSPIVASTLLHSAAACVDVVGRMYLF